MNDLIDAVPPESRTCFVFNEMAANPTVRKQLKPLFVAWLEEWKHHGEAISEVWNLNHDLFKYKTLSTYLSVKYFYIRLTISGCC